jgi:hypothetical protein
MYSPAEDNGLFARYLYKSVGWFMVLNATFNNISAISWQSVLLMKITAVPGENHLSAADQ